MRVAATMLGALAARCARLEADAGSIVDRAPHHYRAVAVAALGRAVQNYRITEY